MSFTFRAGLPGHVAATSVSTLPHLRRVYVRYAQIVLMPGRGLYAPGWVWGE